VPICATPAKSDASAPLTPVPKPAVSIVYRLGLAAVALAMLVLPVLYLALTGAVVWGVYLFGTKCVPGILGWDLRFSHFTLLAMFVCIVTPIATGCAVAFFMIKPIFTRARRAPVGAVHNPAFEPQIGEFIEAVCRAVGAPAPCRIEFDCTADASAGYATGWGGFLRNRMVLRLGLSLVATTSERELAGILAHEFGHFRQGMAMRLSFLVRRVNAWFARVVYQRDGWDERLESAIESEKNWVGFMSVFASLGVMISRGVLWVFMMLGHGISAFLMRQMEFDADAVETQLAGSEAFKSTTRKLVTLHATRTLVDQQIAEIWHFHHHLPDNLPILLEHRMHSLPAQTLHAIELELGKTKTRWTASHPSPCDRMRRAEKMGCAGQQLSDGRARDLFRDFPDLCRAVTVGHYHNLGVPQASDRLIPVKVLLGESASRLPAEAEPASPLRQATIAFEVEQSSAMASTARRR